MAALLALSALGSAAAVGEKIRGVQYVPHQVGEPNNNVLSTVLDVYQSVYRDHHQKHLPLIAKSLGANTLRLQPWNNQATGQTITDQQLSRRPFYETLAKEGIRNLVPTFQLSRYFYDAMEMGQMIDHGPDSPVFQDFEAFLGSIVDFKETFEQEEKANPTFRAWGVDLALDIGKIWDAIPPDGKVEDCNTVVPPTVENGHASPFQRYKDALTALGNRVWPSDRVPQWIKERPLLVPLDLTEYVGVEWPRTQGALRCLTEWLDNTYKGLFSSKKAHWLFSFTLPMPNLVEDVPRELTDCKQDKRCRSFVADGFGKYLDDLAATTFEDAKVQPDIVVMVGAHALAYNTRMAFGGVVEDYGVTTETKSFVPRQQLMLRYAFQEYLELEKQQASSFQGFLLDEWMDNWDRGSAGPFVLVAKEPGGTCGSRFKQDRGPECRRQMTLYEDGSTYYAYPESVGLAATVSRLFFHCAKPRFPFAGVPLLSEASGVSEAGPAAAMVCSLMVPSAVWSTLFAALFLSALLLICCSRGCRRESFAELPTPRRQPEAMREKSVVSATCSVVPTEPSLRGEFRIVASSQHFADRDEAKWWLQAHYDTQLEILERQLSAERLGLQACKERATAVQGARSPAAAPGELAVAVRTLHQRCFEGFDAWCGHTKVRRLDPERRRPLPQLFAECVLMRTVESLSEHVINCPERISALLYDMLQEAYGSPARREDLEMPAVRAVAPVSYAVDVDKLQDGLARMMQNSNPYKVSNVAAFVPGAGARQNELGLNFDDINESGILRLPYVKKTFEEPRSAFVLIDLLLSYRVMLMMKYWVLVAGFYLYLGSGQGRDVTTKYNGTAFQPQYLRLDLWFYAASIDSVAWTLLELLALLYGARQRRNFWFSNIPGAPGKAWLLQHLVCLLLSVASVALLQWDMVEQKLGRRSDKCLNSCSGSCMDPRVSADGKYSFGQFLKVMMVPLGYWLHRFLIFFLLHRRRWPTFLHGKPNPKWDKVNDARVLLIWVVMLACCAYFEGYLLLPVTAGLDYSNQCGLELMSLLTDFENGQQQVGVCTEHWVTSSCVPCVLSVTFVWSLVLLSAMLDIYFVFYIFSALVGGVEGNRRKLNNLKNPGVVIDFRSGGETGSQQLSQSQLAQPGQEAQLLAKAFGPSWRTVWRKIVKDLFDESLVGLRQVEMLLEAAGVRFQGAEELEREDFEHSLQSRELDLASALYGCDLAAERLCFFFRSLRSISQSGRPEDFFRPEMDSLTGQQLHVGSIPSVTMIIPVYNEVVTPSRQWLCEGNRPEDARNQLAGGAGSGERTLPPKGDGLNRNLAFMISQFKEEWGFLSERLGQRDPNILYASFVGNYYSDEDPVCWEVKKWAALRSQTVAKTVLGALKYLRALKSLPAIQEHYLDLPGRKSPEMHAEVFLAHQTFGSKRGVPENDVAVKELLRDNADLPFYLVFDLNEETSVEVKDMVQRFLSCKYPTHRDDRPMKYARVKCGWNEAGRCLEVLEVLPRRFPLRVGHHEDFKSQGKASNQLNALLFASGHCFQALDCNMGTFMGECYKVPFVLRKFLPPDASWEPNRTSPQSRYIGFREYIFTSREGAVGQRHAAAEWTFGTIFQRFLSVLEIRMHYGHPDFLDGFWARNRGGMSKASPVVNLSEDLFAGYNVRMREEKSPHMDLLEFEKGREATFNAASSFFTKIAGGSISVLRSRDNHLLCERIGILHGLSFYFASIGFYLSNLLVDLTTYLYVVIFICFTLASISLGDLKQLDSALGTEWVLSMGLISMVPQFVEMIIEFGAPTAVGKIIVSFLSSTFFYIFQNKNMSAAMKQGIITGSARYFFTGRPPANQHQTWKDMYATYWKSHYHPGLELLVLYLIYCLLVVQSEDGQLPMMLVVASFTTWLSGPLFFSPFPKWRLIKQDLEDFKTFINSKAGMEARSTQEVVQRAARHRCRSLYELCIAEEISKWTERPLKVNCCFILGRLVVMGVLLTALPAGILDFTLPFLAALGLQWLFIMFFFRGQMNNIFMLLSILVWPLMPFLGHLLIGDRARVEDWRTRLPEYIISALVYFTGLGLVKRICIFLLACCWSLRVAWCGASEREAERALLLAVRSCYFYFFEHQTRIFRAYLILVVNLVTSLVLMLLDTRVLGFGLHSWLLLNGTVAQANPNSGFMEGENRISFCEASRERSGSFSSFRLGNSVRRRLGHLTSRLAPSSASPESPARRALRRQESELDSSMELRQDRSRRLSASWSTDASMLWGSQRLSADGSRASLPEGVHGMD